VKLFNKHICYLLLITCTACHKQDNSSVIEKKLSEYDTLILNSVLDVELIQDTINYIRLQSHPTVLKHLETEVTNGNLFIENTYNGNFLMPEQSKVWIQLHTNGLSKIIVNQTCLVHNTVPLTGKELGLVMAGKVNQADLVLQCETFYYWNNFPCGGQIKLSGQVKNLKLWNVALMGIDAKGLQSENALVENNGKADCKITCSQHFTGKLTGDGHILLWGKPTTVMLNEQSGAGELQLQE